MSLTQGQILNNRYRVVNLLGQGGFGAVYRAWDTTLDIPCAVKESFEVSPEGQRQFLREAQILARLSHPNLPRVTNFFAEAGGGQYLVMDFVEGQDLEERLAQAGGRLPESQALGYITQVCDALDYLHQQNPAVIHRDIKPANIKITPAGQAILVDFGVAKVYDPSIKTTVGARGVTPGYSPIEQYGKGITDARSDIYALAATLYTLLTGQEPPEAPQRAVRDPLMLPRQITPGISPVVEAAILKAMHNDPQQRFQSAGEFRKGIRGQLPVVSSQSRVKPLLPAPAPARTWKRVVAGAGWLILLALLAALGGWMFTATRDSRLTQTAQARLNLTEEVHEVAPTRTPSPMPTYTESEVAIPDISSAEEAMAYLVSQANHFKGDEDAPVTMIMFTDFQCPYCGRHATGAGRQIDNEYVVNGQVRLAYFHFAFLGEESLWAAEAAECAGEQDAFWDYFDYLYTHQNGENLGAFSQDNLKVFASAMGLDTEAFNACLDTRRYTNLVQNMTNIARQFGVQSVPTFVINGTGVVGAKDFSEFATIIDSFLLTEP